MLKTSHLPDGKIADVLALTHACTTGNASVNYRMYVPQRPSKVPMAPMGFSHVLRFCLQGGGVFVESGTVTFSSCTITGNTASLVRAHAQKFPSPLCGEEIDNLAPELPHDLAFPTSHPGAECQGLWRICLLLANDL